MMRMWIVLALVGVTLALPNYYEEFRRDTPRNGESLDSLKAAFKCRQLGQECKGLPIARCCGDTVCFKTSFFETGTCINCLSENHQCYENDQCCDELQCDRDKWYHTHGACKPKRNAGDQCIFDTQCPTECTKDSVISVYGTCV